MKKDIIIEIYETLTGAGVVANEGDFSQDWLGHCKSYLRTLRFKKAEPSIGAIAICGSRLQRAGEQMIALPRYRHIGARFLALSEKCHEHVNVDSVQLELVG